ANEGWHDSDDDGADEEFDEDDDVDDQEPGDVSPAKGADAAEEWDPAEPRYKQLDEELADVPDDDIEGEEWKFGLAPGERPPEPEWSQKARREWEEEQKKYDQPDERPRTLDWSDREDVSPRGENSQFNDDDIPF